MGSGWAAKPSLPLLWKGKRGDWEPGNLAAPSQGVAADSQWHPSLAAKEARLRRLEWLGPHYSVRSNSIRQAGPLGLQLVVQGL